MSLHEVDRTQMHANRDALEKELSKDCSGAVKGFLAKVEGAALSAPEGYLTASGEPTKTTDPLTLGVVAGWWADIVDNEIMLAVRTAFMAAYQAVRTGVITKSSLDGLDVYMGRVRDRLVQGTHLGVTVAGDAFNSVRVAVAQGATQGWSREQLAQRIAVDLGWEQDGAYWRNVKEQAAARIDAILDPLGAPGSLSREQARLHDPEVQGFRDQMNLATKNLDREHSHWSGRALLIARTEATGANNFAAQRALIDEGVLQKEWLATEDARTRETHRLADGQTVGVAGQFLVGGSTMMFPGDPSAPIEEVANCRCIIVGVRESVTASAGEFNWVEKAGGLPQYIKRIAKHLQEKGMEEGRAIATAVNVAKKACATGDLNYPGVQQENAASRAEACDAVKEWEEKKAKAHVDDKHSLVASLSWTEAKHPRVPKGNGSLSGRFIPGPVKILGDLVDKIEGGAGNARDADEASDAESDLATTLHHPLESQHTRDILKSTEKVLRDYGESKDEGEAKKAFLEAADHLKTFLGVDWSGHGDGSDEDLLGNAEHLEQTLRNSGGARGFMGNLSSLQQSHLYDYMGVGYEPLNKFLRGEKGVYTTEKGEDLVSTMDSIFMEHSQPTTEPMLVLRGLDPDRIPRDVLSQLENLREGDEFADLAYVSTTSSPSVAYRFGHYLQLHIDVPPGSHLIPGHGAEKELILPRGSKFKVTKVTTEDTGRTTIRLSLLLGD